jgi:hypothetical protein
MMLMGVTVLMLLMLLMLLMMYVPPRRISAVLCSWGRQVQIRIPPPSKMTTMTAMTAAEAR